MVPALAALAARSAGSDQPAPLFLEGSGGRLVFLPDDLEGEPLNAYEILCAAALGPGGQRE